MRFALTSLGIFAVALVLFMGEVAWLILLCVFVGRVAFGLRHLVCRCAIVVSGIAILPAHFQGYKLYGSATVRDNRPVLDSPHELASFVAPNIALAADGSRFEVQGVTFTPDLFALPAENLGQLINRGAGPVLVQADASSLSGVVFQARCYWCGNTFFPRFTPARLPRYTKTDLGHYQTGYKLATAHKPE